MIRRAVNRKRERQNPFSGATAVVASNRVSREIGNHDSVIVEEDIPKAQAEIINTARMKRL